MSIRPTRKLPPESSAWLSTAPLIFCRKSRLGRTGIRQSPLARPPGQPQCTTNSVCEILVFSMVKGLYLVEPRHSYIVAADAGMPRSFMTAFLGWTLIVVTLGAVSLAVLLPVLWLLRRVRPHFKGAVWAYVVLSAVSCIAVWYAIPVVVHGFFGHAAH